MLWRYSRKDTKVLLLATLLVFSGYGLLLGQSWRTLAPVAPSPTTTLANTVGVFAGVPENEINTYVAALDAREAALDAREASLETRAAPVDRRTLSIVSIGGAGLLGLILLNFYLDTKRRVSFA